MSQRASCGHSPIAEHERPFGRAFRPDRERLQRLDPAAQAQVAPVHIEPDVAQDVVARHRAAGADRLHAGPGMCGDRDRDDRASRRSRQARKDRVTDERAGRVDQREAHDGAGQRVLGQIRQRDEHAAQRLSAEDDLASAFACRCQGVSAHLPSRSYRASLFATGRPIEAMICRRCAGDLPGLRRSAVNELLHSRACRPMCPQRCNHTGTGGGADAGIFTPAPAL